MLSVKVIEEHTKTESSSDLSCDSHTAVQMTNHSRAASLGPLNFELWFLALLGYTRLCEMDRHRKTGRSVKKCFAPQKSNEE